MNYIYFACILPERQNLKAPTQRSGKQKEEATHKIRENISNNFIVNKNSINPDFLEPSAAASAGAGG